MSRPSIGKGDVMEDLRVLSRLSYEGLMANVSERRRPNTANPKGLVRAMYVAGEECQARSDRNVKVSNKGYQCLQS
jgi:hypothetical protein